MATYTRTEKPRKVIVDEVTLTLSRNEAIALWSLLRRTRQSPAALSDGRRTILSELRDIRDALSSAFKGDLDQFSVDPTRVIGGPGAVVRTESSEYISSL